MERKAVVIGAGIGGLSIALRLNSMGYSVTVFEKNNRIGGKAGQIYENGFRFDTGPSLFTMPDVLNKLLKDINAENLLGLELFKPEIICKYFYDDIVINAYSNLDKLIEELTLKTTDKRESFISYFKYAETIFNLTEKIFLHSSLNKLKTYFNKSAFKALLNLSKIDTNRTMHNAVESYFKDEKTIKLFDRYATYNGSSPFKAPATLNLISHVENGIGGYFIKGGMYNLPKQLTELAIKRGVNIVTNSQIVEIITDKNRVKEVKVKTGDVIELFSADLFVSNSDITNTHKIILPNENVKTNKNEISSSAIVFYWGINKTNPSLEMHNIIFSKDYKNEFYEIHELKKVPSEPTIYIYISSKAEKTDAPNGCENWFVMINAPYNNGQDWSNEIEKVKPIIINKINEKLNTDIQKHIVFEKIISPINIEKETLSYKGGLYGDSSNSKYSAFLRQQNKSNKFNNLYFVGGSVHPGGGIPLVMLSAEIASQLIKEDYALL